jgi:enoyl-CoA hydratase
MTADFHESVADGVVTIAFDAPRTRNALTRATRVALVERFDALDADPAVRVVVVTGTDPAFSSGVDAKELLSTPGYVAPPVDPATALRRMTTPVIAAVNGSCVSGGLEIALACSFILASAEARFADTHARIGITPGWGLSVDLPDAVGIRRARQLTLTGQPIDAATALAWGLVNEVVPHAELRHRAGELAAQIAALGEPIVRHALALYRDGQEQRLGSARDLERDALETWTVDRGDSRERFDDR